MAVVTKTRLAVALKTRWRKKGPRTVDDNATIAGFNIWKIAQETFKHMESEGFRFGGDAQVMQVVIEFVAFLVQATDRIIYGHVSESERGLFINALAKHLATTLQTNMLDLRGPGDYQQAFVDTLNARFRDYSEYSFTADGPSYGYVRYLGERVSETMESSDNRWVVEHVMEIEAPDMLKFLKKVIADVLGVGGADKGAPTVGD